MTIAFLIHWRRAGDDHHDLRVDFRVTLADNLQRNAGITMVDGTFRIEVLRKDRLGQDAWRDIGDDMGWAERTLPTIVMSELVRMSFEHRALAFNAGITAGEIHGGRLAEQGTAWAERVPKNWTMLENGILVIDLGTFEAAP